MTIYEINRLIEEIELQLRILYDRKESAFDSTQPKAVGINSMMAQSSHSNNKYTAFDYSIDEIEPKIKKLEKRLDKLKAYKKEYYIILDKYDPILKKIIVLREEKKLNWKTIAKYCNYSEKSCRIKYNNYKNEKINLE